MPVEILIKKEEAKVDEFKTQKYLGAFVCITGKDLWIL